MKSHTQSNLNRVKRKTKIVLCASALLTSAILTSTSTMAVNGHYVPGVEGIQGASVPPPGTYYRGYVVHYDIDKLTDNKGNSVPGSNTVKVTA